jgi:predicted nucleotidyltransferase
VNTLAEKGVLKKKKLGAAIYCSLNYGNDDLLKMLIQIEGDNFEEFLKVEKKLSKPLRELKDRLPERTNFNLLSAVLFGSYAKGKAVPKSDLDLFFIVSLKDQYRELIESETLSLSGRYGININPVLAEPMEFVKMVRAKEPNLAHEIIRNKIILYGREKFWEFVTAGLR